MPYVKVVGIEVLNDGSGRASQAFTPEEEETFISMARDPEIYTKIWKVSSSICVACVICSAD